MTSDHTALVETIGPEGPFNNYADSYVPFDHIGPCALYFCGRTGPHWAVFPSREAAITAAVGACRYDVGGYSDVAVYPLEAAPSDAENYTSVADWLFGDEDFKDNEFEQFGVIEIVRKVMRELARRLAIHPEELSQVEWRDLERLLSEVFHALGFDAKLTRSAKDGGYDIILGAEGQTYFVEVKHWSERSKVGSRLVNEFTEIVVSNNVEGMLISTSGFTKQVVRARSEISRSPVVLGADLKVITLCRHYLQSENGLWTRDGGLREVFFENAF